MTEMPAIRRPDAVTIEDLATDDDTPPEKPFYELPFTTDKQPVRTVLPEIPPTIVRVID